MVRPKADTEAGKQATIKWRQTMLKRFGSEEAFKEHVREMGHRGGKTKTTKPKGFAANLALASLAGCKGGRISRRRKKNDIDKAEKLLERENGRA